MLVERNDQSSGFMKVDNYIKKFLHYQLVIICLPILLGNFFNVDHGNEDDGKENIDQEDAPVKDRHAMKLFMNPYGKVRDLKAMEQQFGPNDILNLNSDGMLSPDRCAQLVTALNAPKGKGNNIIEFKYALWNDVQLKNFRC